MDLVKVNPYVVPGVKHTPTDDVIENIVCRVFKITPEQIKTKTRKQPVPAARQTYYWLSRKYLKKGVIRTAEKYGQDHSTVIHSVRAIENMVETGHEYGELAKKCEEILRGQYVL